MVDYVTSDNGKGIYAYIDVETLEPVYVGQTKQSFRERDNAHRYNLGCSCPFDKKLMFNQSKYVMIPLIYSDDPGTLDLMETFYIYHFDTIGHGNRLWGGEIDQFEKNSPRYRYDIEDDEIIKLYYNEKLSTKEIGKKLYCSPNTVTNRLKNKGLPIRDVDFAHSLRVNTSGYYRVNKRKNAKYKQVFIWCYAYREGGKVKQILSVSVDKLEEKVKAKGLPWIKFDEEE